MQYFLQYWFTQYGFLRRKSLKNLKNLQSLVYHINIYHRSFGHFKFLLNTLQLFLNIYSCFPREEQSLAKDLKFGFPSFFFFSFYPRKFGLLVLMNEVQWNIAVALNLETCQKLRNNAGKATILWQQMVSIIFDLDIISTYLLAW